MLTTDLKLPQLVFILLAALSEVSPQYLPRVVGGVPTTIDQYPIMAQLLVDTWGTQQFEQHCAAVILTPSHLLSTAHCFLHQTHTGKNYTHPEFWRVRVGSSSRTRGGSIHQVKRIIPHEHFDTQYYNNDVAVIIVTTLTFSKNVRQATLIQQGAPVGTGYPCVLPGWGAKQVDGVQPEFLQHATMFIIDQKTCRDRYQTIGARVTDSMLCAGRLDVGGLDACFGDSGGPLIYKGVVAGLVSFGYSCGHQYYPGVYTRVSYYTDWILKTVTENKF